MIPERWATGILLPAMVLAMGCKRSTPLTAVERAHVTYEQRCAPCHGPRGHGDGPAAQALVPHPRDFADATWQRSRSDDELRRVIVHGGTALGGSTFMPANPDLAREAEVVDSLVTLIRRFGPAPTP